MKSYFYEVKKGAKNFKLLETLLNQNIIFILSMNHFKILIQNFEHIINF